MDTTKIPILISNSGNFGDLPLVTGWLIDYCYGGGEGVAVIVSLLIIIKRLLFHSHAPTLPSLTSGENNNEGDHRNRKIVQCIKLLLLSFPFTRTS
jgi:hypothetical protein